MYVYVCLDTWHLWSSDDFHAHACLFSARIFEVPQIQPEIATQAYEAPDIETLAAQRVPLIRTSLRVRMFVYTCTCMDVYGYIDIHYVHVCEFI